MGCRCSAFENKEELLTHISEPLLDIIKSQFEEYKLLMYSKSDCADSIKLKRLFRQHNLQFEYFDLDNMSEGSQLLAALQKLTLNLSTPYVFSKGKYIGGLLQVTEAINSQSLKP